MRHFPHALADGVDRCFTVAFSCWFPAGPEAELAASEPWSISISTLEMTRLTQKINRTPWISDDFNNSIIQSLLGVRGS